MTGFRFLSVSLRVPKWKVAVFVTHLGAENKIEIFQKKQGDLLCFFVNNFELQSTTISFKCEVLNTKFCRFFFKIQLRSVRRKTKNLCFFFENKKVTFFVNRVTICQAGNEMRSTFFVNKKHFFEEKKRSHFLSIELRSARQETK